MDKFDLIVIGAGTAGLQVVAAAVEEGKKVAVLENDLVGGTCLNRGCIPTKVLVHAAELARQAKNARHFGINYTGLKLNFAQAIRHEEQLVSKGRTQAEKNLASMPGVTLLRGTAEFIDSSTVKVGTKAVSAEKIFIVTGSSPFVPPIPGLEKTGYLDSTSALHSQKQPKALIMIGGGYISVEFAAFFAAFGTKVTIVEMADRLVGTADSDISSALLEYLTKDGIKVLLGAGAKEIKKKGRKKLVTYEQNGKMQTISADELFVAIGRKANTAGLKAENAGVKLDKKGFVVVNEFLQTDNPNIFAVGDVNGKAMFAHMGKYEAALAFHNAFNPDDMVKADYHAVPFAVFTDPEIGGVGLNEAQVKEAGIEIGRAHV